MALEPLHRRLCPLVLACQEDSLNLLGHEQPHGLYTPLVRSLRDWEALVHKESPPPVAAEGGGVPPDPVEEPLLRVQLRIRLSSQVRDLEEGRVEEILYKSWHDAEGPRPTLESLANLMRTTLHGGELSMARPLTTLDHPVACIHLVPEEHPDPVQWCLSSQALLKSQVEPMATQVCSPDILHFFVVVTRAKDHSPRHQDASPRLPPPDTMAAMSHVFGTNVAHLALCGNGPVDSASLETLFHTFVAQALIPFMRNYITSSMDRQHGNHPAFSLNFAGKILAAGRKLLTAPSPAATGNPQDPPGGRSVADPQFLLFRALDFALLIGDWPNFDVLLQKTLAASASWRPSIHQSLRETYSALLRGRTRPLSVQAILDAVSIEASWEVSFELLGFVAMLQEIRAISVADAAVLLESLQRRIAAPSGPLMSLLLHLLCFEAHSSLEHSRRGRAYDLYMIARVAKESQLRHTAHLALSNLQRTMMEGGRPPKFKLARALLSCQAAEEHLEGPISGLDCDWWVQVPPSLQSRVLQSLPPSDGPLIARFLRVTLVPAAGNLDPALSHLAQCQIREVQTALAGLKVMATWEGRAQRIQAISTSVQLPRRHMVIENLLSIPISISCLGIKSDPLAPEAVSTINLSDMAEFHLDGLCETRLSIPAAHPVTVDSRSAILLEFRINGRLFVTTIYDSLATETVGEGGHSPRPITTSSDLHLALEVAQEHLILLNHQVLNGTLKLRNKTPRPLQDLHLGEGIIGLASIPPDEVISASVCFFLTRSSASRQAHLLSLVIPSLVDSVELTESPSTGLAKLTNSSPFSMNSVTVRRQQDHSPPQGVLWSTSLLRAASYSLFLADHPATAQGPRGAPLLVFCTIHGAGYCLAPTHGGASSSSGGGLQRSPS